MNREDISFRFRVFSEYPHHGGQGCLRWICNPNNPTGTCVSSTELYPSDDENELFVIDQSYEDYTTATMLRDEDIVKHGRMILLHSMTKKVLYPRFTPWLSDSTS